MASAPRYGGSEPGLNVIADKGVIKYKQGVHPDSVVVHLAGRRPLRLRRGGIGQDQQAFISKLCAICPKIFSKYIRKVLTKEKDKWYIGFTTKFFKGE
jgi:hypothetical protein